MMEKISKLLYALLGRTQQGTAVWQQTADDDTFQYALPDSSIWIQEKGNTYYIYVLNDEGRIIERVSSIDLEKASDGRTHHHDMMKALFLLARRDALKADATLDGILNQLGVKA